MGLHRKHSVVLLRLLCVAMLTSTLYTSALAQTPTDPPVQQPTTIYLPFVANMPVKRLPFGVQIDGPPLSPELITNAQKLNVGWLRYPLSWRTAQPDEGQPIQWERLAGFEQALRLASEAGISVQVPVFDSPHWATINKPYPTSCGAMRTNTFQAFADFMRQVINRYKAAPFNVHDWELGNEVDVDPRLVAPDHWFGCWGDIDDTEYYGGQQYGAMLKAVVPTLRTQDSALRIWHGSLLLDKPFTTDPTRGKPERFLNGVLAAGGGPYFDVLPFHAYPTYTGLKIDHENQLSTSWTALGGWVLGKARFLRTIMASYGVNKPLFLNETALLCPYNVQPTSAFYQMQGVYAVRTFTRALAEGIIGMTWFTLNGPGWMNTGLLYYDTPTVAFSAFQQFTTQVQWTDLKPYRIFYAPNAEAYTFHGETNDVQIVWARSDETVPISVPRSSFVRATDMLGNSIEPTFTETAAIINVPFEPVYISVKTP